VVSPVRQAHHRLRPFALSLSKRERLRTGLPNHERIGAMTSRCLPFTPFDWLRTGFDGLRANGRLVLL